MEKDGGSKYPFTRRTGGSLLKKEKVKRISCVGAFSDMDHQLSHSKSKRLNFLKKFHDHRGGIDLASAPRKPRSAMKKRHHESQTICDPLVPPISNKIGGFELQSKNCMKKHKVTVDKQEDSEESVITKDEEEAAEALFVLAQTFNGTAEVEQSSMPGKSIHMEQSIEADDTKNSDVRKSQKRCPVHIHICRFIEGLQTTESKELGIDEVSRQEARVDVVSDFNSEKVKEYADKMSYKVENAHKGLFQERQLQDLVALYQTNPKNQYPVSFEGHLSTATVQQELPYLHTMDHHHSQWSTNIFSRQQQYHRNQFMLMGCYHNWQNQRRNTMAPLSGSSIKIYGSQCKQGSLLQVTGSKPTLNTPQQQQCTSMSLSATNKGKMQFRDDKGSLFFIDSGPTLKLSL